MDIMNGKADIYLVPPRTPLGEKGVIESLAKLFEKSSGQQNADDIVSFQIQALRVLGNLCFDHGRLPLSCFNVDIYTNLHLSTRE
jgi:hypothetical protein